MKDQYFGDINDYHKYALLRDLSGDGTLLAICWALTQYTETQSGDGSRLAYLEHPDRWRHFDPELFDHLRQTVAVDGVRNVRGITPLLQSAFQYCPYLPDDVSGRVSYFKGFGALGCHLAFFDPDNGLGVGSVPYGRKGCSRYVYPHELRLSWDAGRSVLLYQHFPRVQREEFTRELTARLQRELPGSDASAVYTPHVLYVLLSQPKHLHLATRLTTHARKWATWVRHLSTGGHLT